MAVRLENLPGFNPHAATPEHVYPLDSVLPIDVGRCLYKEAEELVAAVGDGDAIEVLRGYAAPPSPPLPAPCVSA